MWGYVYNLSCENEFYLHENEKWFPYQTLSTYPRFETEARENSEMAYWYDNDSDNGDDGNGDDDYGDGGVTTTMMMILNLQL